MNGPWLEDVKILVLSKASVKKSAPRSKLLQKTYVSGTFSLQMEYKSNEDYWPHGCRTKEWS